MMTRAAKTATIDGLAVRFRGSDIVIAGYRDLTVAQLDRLRSALRGCADFTVTKNTLARRAAHDAGLELSLTGPTAVAFVTGDTAVAARVLNDFAREHPALVLKGGVVGGRVLGSGEIGRLEPRTVLLARLASAMTAKTTQMAQLADALRAAREDGHGEDEQR
jgi:large subunit ribosomal protein L10